MPGTLAQAITDVLAPLLAGALVVAVGLLPILAIDVTSFAVALIVLLLVSLPAPKRGDGEMRKDRPSVPDGWRYIRGRRDLVPLLALLAMGNPVSGFLGAALAPMVLGFASPTGLGLIPGSPVRGCSSEALWWPPPGDRPSEPAASSSARC